MEAAYSNFNSIDSALWIWFALTAVSGAFVAWDLLTRTPEMKVMKWGWILVTLYYRTGRPRRLLVFVPRTRAFYTRKVYRAALETSRRLDDLLYGGRRNRHYRRGGNHESSGFAGGH